MYHRYKSNELLCCPKCNGRLELETETKAVAIIKRIIGGVSCIKISSGQCHANERKQ